MRYVAFDIETAAVVPEGADWRDGRPLGITCAAIAWELPDDSICTQVRHGRNPDGSPAPYLSQAECADIVQALQTAVAHGYTLLTWNGLGFDFEILAEESGLRGECAALALGHVDMMYQVLCLKGYPLSLNAAAKGLGLVGKTEGVDGAQAPMLWAEGKHAEVLEYVQQDVRTTLEVALAVEKRRGLRWTSKAGKLQTLPIAQWLTVAEARQLPLPDTSWMATPLDRHDFAAWMEAAAAE